MKIEQFNASEWEVSKDVQNHFLLVDGQVYYLSNAYDDPNLSLYIPKHLRSLVVTQNHDNKCHKDVFLAAFVQRNS